MLSSLPERLGRFDLMGPPCPSRLRPPAAFVQLWGDCQEHGRFPLNMQDERGREHRHGEWCPACRAQDGANALLAGCNIPERFQACTFENFVSDTEQRASVLRTCRAYAENFAVHRSVGRGLILCGSVGTGKNHLATAICKALLAQRRSVLRVKAAQFLDEMWAKPFGERDAWIAGLARVDLLLLDEVGRSSQAKAAQDAFFRLIDARYEAVRPTLVTSNLDRAGLIEVLSDAGYDRLTEGGTERLTLNWPSARAGIKAADKEHTA